MQLLIVFGIILKAIEFGKTRKYYVAVTKEIKKYAVAQDEPKDFQIVPSQNELDLTADHLVFWRGIII